MAKERLQKLLAAAGWGSRRSCEELIRDGRATVNGQVRDEMPVLVDAAEDDIRIDGRRLKPQRLVYHLLNKPKGVFCTNDDPEGRTRAIDLLPRVKERVYPVGRLDATSTGLLLLTNDGELAERLMHPRYGIEKTYIVEVQGQLSVAAKEKLQKGIWMSEGKTQPAKIKVLKSGHRQNLLEITLREGRKREIRRMLAAVGYRVKKLSRVKMGPLRIKGLGVGQSRALTSEEIRLLKKVSDQAAARVPSSPRRKPGRRR
jgi:23S rRNA pseudouridine2605 synthase